MAKKDERPDAPGAPPEAPPRSESRMTPAEREEALVRQRALGKRLKPMWDDVVNEDLPDEFMSLLSRMDEGDPKKGSSQ